MVTPSVSAETVLSVTEVLDGINNLCAADIVRFKRASQYLCFGGARPPEDLRHEAIRRLAAGTRHCRRNISIIASLCGAMRSIASADRKSLRRRPELVVVPEGHADAGVYGGVDPRLSPEDRLIIEEEAAEMKQKILDLFTDDVVAQS
jgi:hypothetical protein